MKKTETRPYDAAAYLKTDEDCALYLQVVMEEEDVTERMIAAALGDIARARGMMQIARETGLAREALYRALSPTGSPSLATTLKVMRALGMRLTTTTLKPPAPHKPRARKSPAKPRTAAA